MPVVDGSNVPPKTPIRLNRAPRTPDPSLSLVRLRFSGEAVPSFLRRSSASFFAIFSITN